MIKTIGVIVLLGISYIVFAMAFDPWGYGSEHDIRMEKAHRYCVEELGITKGNGHTDHALHNCIMKTANYIKRGGPL